MKQAKREAVRRPHKAAARGMALALTDMFSARVHELEQELRSAFAAVRRWRLEAE